MSNKLSSIKYGTIELMAKYPFNRPTKEVYESWKEDFFKLKETESFDIYLVGSFSEKLFDDNIEPSDVDIILIGNGGDEKIEKLLYEGTRLGIEKYNTFFDILWFSMMPNYKELFENKKMLQIMMGLIDPELLVDGVNMNKPFKYKQQVRKKELKN